MRRQPPHTILDSSVKCNGLSIGFAADAERWIARIIYEERMPAPRIYLPVGHDHSGERVPRQLVNIAEGARHMITIGRPCEHLAPTEL